MYVCWQARAGASKPRNVEPDAPEPRLRLPSACKSHLAAAHTSPSKLTFTRSSSSCRERLSACSNFALVASLLRVLLQLVARFDSLAALLLALLRFFDSREQADSARVSDYSVFLSAFRILAMNTTLLPLPRSSLRQAIADFVS